jgi:hypothetical protein
MRYIKLYEEFTRDEFGQVMMSICEDMSFEVYEDFPSTEDVRVYLVDGLPNIDRSRYEEYLGADWHIISKEYEYLDKTMVSFVKGDVNIAALKWMKDVYGDLRREEEHLPSTEWGAYGEKAGISYNYTDGTGRKIMSFIVREGEPDPFDSNNKNTWKLKIYFNTDVRDFLRSCFGKKMDITGLDGHHSFVRVVSTWMKDVYGIKGVVRFRRD